MHTCSLSWLTTDRSPNDSLLKRQNFPDLVYFTIIRLLFSGTFVFVFLLTR
ncbi:hypothetical protein [Enterococcus florum]|uniref:hypothetical protein n=1 Tax=Enterococcus florum TaxID=2480627 RepID=UPI00158DC29B|nr:hypothetical protein [Enterococcus florum]